MRSPLGKGISRRLVLLVCAALAVAVALGATAPNVAACSTCIAETSVAYVFCEHHPKGTEYVGCNFNVTCGPETKSPQEIYEVECAG